MPNHLNLLLALSGLAAAQVSSEAPLGMAPGLGAAAGAETEYLVTMPLAGMVPHSEVRGTVRETDWLPPGQSADSATRLVTVERMSGGAGPDAPLRFIRGVSTCFADCAGRAPNPVDQTPVQGHPAARVRVDIPLRRTTGRPGTLYALAISGDRDLHVVVVTVPGPPSEADERFAQDVLRSVVLCTRASREPACRPH